MFFNDVTRLREGVCEISRSWELASASFLLDISSALALIECVLFLLVLLLCKLSNRYDCPCLVAFGYATSPRFVLWDGAPFGNVAVP